MTTPHDRHVVRGLAQRVADLAALPVMAERRRRWTDHNALRGDRRPLVLCFPEGCWPELVSPAALVCTDPTLRAFEHQLRHTLYTAEVLRDDQPVEPVFNVNWSVHCSDYGVAIPHHRGDNRGSYTWDPPLVDLDADFARLRPRTFAVDRDATARKLAAAQDVLGDILTVRIRSWLWWSCGLTQTLAFLVGIEQAMLAMIDQPAALHRLMAFLRDDMAAYADWAQREGLLTAGNANDYVGSGGLAYSDELPTPVDTARNADRWGFAESQETVGISPTMFEEFVMPYQRPLLERFALNCYGCCEELEHRIDVVLREVPRLRRVSVSPKANQAALADKLAGRYVFSRKADPVPVCVEFDEAQIRRDIRHTLDVAAGQPLEIILKDTHTVRHEPHRLSRWVELAREEIAARFGPQ